MEDIRRKIPSIDELLKERYFQRYPRKLVQEVLREVTEKWRHKLKSKELVAGLKPAPTYENLVEDALLILERDKLQSFRKAINATGVILSTNLGRAPIIKEAIDSVAQVSSGYSNLEIDLKTGKRGERYSHVAPLLQKLTGAEASVVVNNNAAAVFLILDTFAKGKEVIVSRGELIEIGGSFRLPDVLKKSGCKLVEVGTTNRTYIEDYEQAIAENTALLLKSHTSNYKIVGFTHTPSLEEFVKLGKKYNILTVEDLGSGLFVDLTSAGLPYEPTVQEIVDSGIDIVSFSGDKLLGGPQAGIILGKKDLIDEMKKNPLLRPLRVGKYTLAVLETVLRTYLYEENPISKIPHLSILTEPPSSVKSRVEKLCKSLSQVMGKEFNVKVETSVSEIGGGAYPGVEIPTFVVAITSFTRSPHDIQKALRECNPPIIARVAHDKTLLDARTIFENEIHQIINGIRNLLPHFSAPDKSGQLPVPTRNGSGKPSRSRKST